jgi:hypothetical protein
VVNQPTQPFPPDEDEGWDPLAAVVYDTALAAIHHTVAAATALLLTEQDPQRVEDLLRIRADAVRTRRELPADDTAVAADTALRYADISRDLTGHLPGGGDA